MPFYNYDHLDFLENFDIEHVIDEEAGIYSYDVTSKEGFTLHVYMITCEDTVCFTLSSKEGLTLVDLGLHNITSIVCDKSKPGIVRFLFYQADKKVPIVTAFIKPTIALSFDIEHRNDVNDFPYRKSLGSVNEFLSEPYQCPNKMQKG